MLIKLFKFRLRSTVCLSYPPIIISMACVILASMINDSVSNNFKNINWSNNEHWLSAFGFNVKERLEVLKKKKRERNDNDNNKEDGQPNKKLKADNSQSIPQNDNNDNNENNDNDDVKDEEITSILKDVRDCMVRILGVFTQIEDVDTKNRVRQRMPYLTKVIQILPKKRNSIWKEETLLEI